jgi:hypothetical protein
MKRSLTIAFVAIILVWALFSIAAADERSQAAPVPAETQAALQSKADLKWIQMPDLDPTGMDVSGTCPGFSGQCDVLADDFLCDETGAVTEIHVYGSWFEDMYPYGDPGQVSFVLSIHADVPAGIDAQYSHPGELLWMRQFAPGEFDYIPVAGGLLEGFFDPVQQFYIPMSDYTCWMYIFIITDEPFIQQGSAEQPIIYWLDVQAFPMGESYFGWKTSIDHWNDDAVWYPGQEPVPPVPMLWQELRYPIDHPWAGMSIDLAFEIYAEGQPCDCTPGNCNGDGTINILDITYLINYLYKGGPAPIPYRLCSGDANCNCTVNILDITYLINFLYKGGPAPCTCLQWLSACGPPLRK